MSEQTYVFECNSGTYMDCIEQSVFGSNKPWPLEIKDGDYCLLHHYEIGGLLGIWQAVGNGGRNLVPGLWKNKFPFQVRVKLLLPKPQEVPRKLLHADAARTCWPLILCCPHQFATLRHIPNQMLLASAAARCPARALLASHTMQQRLCWLLLLPRLPGAALGCCCWMTWSC